MEKIRNCTPENMHLYVEELDVKVENLTEIIKKIFNLEIENNYFKNNPIVAYYDEKAKMEKNCRLMDLKIKDCEIPIRAINALSSMDIQTIGELLNCEKSRLLKCRNLGRKTLTEIEEFLKQYRVALK